jgi:hypothetical protein
MTPLSTKQQAIMMYLERHAEISLAQALSLCGGYYANGQKHMGGVLTNMIRRGLIVRVRPGLYAKRPRPAPETVLELKA